jgi:8-oxo-dGTP diphosphatase
MSHRLSAGVIVVDRQDRVALVRHVKPDVYDFWVAPGGGVHDREEVRDAARREAFEEAGLHVAPGRLLYIEQLYAPVAKVHQVKFWFHATVDDAPRLNSSHPEATLEWITEARWLTRADMADKTIFPSCLEQDFWAARARGFGEPVVLPVRVMTFE